MHMKERGEVEDTQVNETVSFQKGKKKGFVGVVGESNLNHNFPPGTGLGPCRKTNSDLKKGDWSNIFSRKAL